MPLVRLIARLALAAALACTALTLLALTVGGLRSDDAVIAFVQVRDEDTEIYLVDIDSWSLSMVNLTRNPGSPDDNPIWLSDGETLVFTTYRDDFPFHMMSLTDGQDSQFRGEDGLFSNFFGWSGKHLAYLGYEYTANPDDKPGFYAPVLYIVDTTSGDVQPIQDFLMADTLGAAQWSPDGSRLAVIATSNDGEWAVYVMQSDGSDLRRLTHIEVSGLGGLAWSPDGEKIAFTGSGSEGEQIFTVDLNDGSLDQLTHMPIGSLPVNPSWSPDGRRIAFAESLEYVTDGNLYVMDTDGSNIRFIASHATYPAWRP